MKWSRLICLVALASQLVASGAAADRAAATPDDNSGTAKVPPVLRPSEPRDSWQVTLPGPPPGAPAPGKKVSFTLPSPAPVAPVAKPAPIPAKPVPDATPRRSLPLFVSAAQAKPSPPSLQIGREVAAYCQKQIGHWKENDARKLLGEPKRHRPAYDEKNSVNGTIYALPTPPITTRSWNSFSTSNPAPSVPSSSIRRASPESNAATFGTAPSPPPMPLAAANSTPIPTAASTFWSTPRAMSLASAGID